MNYFGLVFAFLIPGMVLGAMLVSGISFAGSIKRKAQR